MVGFVDSLQFSDVLFSQINDGLVRFRDILDQRKQVGKIGHLQRMRSLVTDFGRTNGIKVSPTVQTIQAQHTCDVGPVCLQGNEHVGGSDVVLCSDFKDCLVLEERRSIRSQWRVSSENDPLLRAEVDELLLRARTERTPEYDSVY